MNRKVGGSVTTLVDEFHKLILFTKRFVASQESDDGPQRCTDRIEDSLRIDSAGE